MFLGVSVRQKRPPFWYRAHVQLQRLGVILGVLGAILGVVMVGSSTPHFSVRHTQLGLAVTVLGLMQPVIAAKRPPSSPRTTSRKVCECVFGELWWSSLCCDSALTVWGSCSDLVAP